jgi:hypothetical protein
MTAIPLTETAAKRRIGDILLAHGFVTEQQIADATAEQERTQQPLGQILVGQGAITRLELASALAEQWSDPAASIPPTPRSAPAAARTPAPLPSPKDEAQYAARLQEAVADLARKVQSNEPLEGIDERVEELSRRIESTLARTQHIEAAVATLAESLEGVSQGVEEAFRVLQTGTANLATDMARIEQSVSELAAREPPEGDGTSFADLEDLRCAVAELGEKGVSDEATRTEVGAVAARLDELSGSFAALQALDQRVERMTGLLEALDQTTALDELRRSLSDLEATSSSSAELAERLGRVEAVSGDEHLRTALDGQAALLDDVRANVEGVVAQLATLESRLDANVAELDDVTERVGVQDDPAGERRLDELTEAVEELRQAMTDVAAASRPDESTPEWAEALRAEIERLDRERGESLALAGKLEELEARLADGIVTPNALTESIGWAMSERPAPVADERFTELAAEVATLRAGFTSLADASDHQAGTDPRLIEIEARVEALASDRTNDVGLASRLGELEQARLGDLDTVDVLARALDRIRHDLTTAPPSTEHESSKVMDAVSELAQRMAALEESRAVEPAAVGHDPSELAAENEAFRLVLERIPDVDERLQELTALVQELAAAQQAAGAPPPSAAASSLPADIGARVARVEEAESASPSDAEKLMNRLERMASSIDWRLQRLESDETTDAE